MYEKRAKSWFLIYCKWLFVEVSAFEPDMAPYPRVSACQFEIKGRSQSAHCNNLKRFPTATKSIRKRKPPRNRKYAPLLKGHPGY